jgi:hypothetical protein
MQAGHDDEDLKFERVAIHLVPEDQLVCRAATGAISYEFGARLTVVQLPPSTCQKFG